MVGCLTHWAGDGPPKLDILISNAAQTLTDSIEKEGQSIRQEEELSAVPDTLVVGGSYIPRIRGGVAGQYPIQGPVGQETAAITSVPQDNPRQDVADHPLSAVISKDQTNKSSWMQGLSQIPYEDVISAHSVNTFVPFILLRELLPYLSASSSQEHLDPTSASNSKLTKPRAYVVNVSSREGLFELTPDHPSKAGHHVHTNMSKAALNMLTETEAGPAWAKWRVAINTVDPGYMSADPVYMAHLASKRAGKDRKIREKVQESPPIGWEDGAGRVLWPIAKGEKGEIIRGRFLKHFVSVPHGVR